MKFKNLILTTFLACIAAFATIKADVVTVDWPDSNPIFAVTNYNVLVGTNVDANWGLIATVPTSSYSADFAPGSRYFIRVQALNLRGVGTATSSAATPVAPVAPSGLTNQTTGNVVALGWNPSPPAEMIYHYNVLIATNADANYSAFSQVTTNVFTTPPLNQGFTYFFKVNAVNFGGTSLTSGSTSSPGFAAQPGTPTIISIVP